jgi:hypothetical protein
MQYLARTGTHKSRTGSSCNDSATKLNAKRRHSRKYAIASVHDDSEGASVNCLGSEKWIAD